MLSVALVTLAASLVAAQADGPVAPLNANPTDTSNFRALGKAFPFAHLPFQADTSVEAAQPGVVFRGPQFGYNNCTGRPAAQDANCQTLIVNDITDFCVYAPPKFDTIANSEGETVAYCTKPTHGSRVIPAGTILGITVLNSPSYIAIKALMNLANLNVNDIVGEGGELDSGGADQRANPIGELAYSSNLPFSKGTMTQARTWHQFIGAGQVCLKLCDDKAPNARGLCRHVLDTDGCEVNIPAQVTEGVFQTCDSDDQVSPQKDVIAPLPVTRNCVTSASAALYPITAGIPTATAPPGGASTPPAGVSNSNVTPSGTKPTVPSGTKSPTSTPTGAAASRVNPVSFGAIAAAFFGLAAGAVIV